MLSARLPQYLFVLIFTAFSVHAVAPGAAGQLASVDDVQATGPLPGSSLEDRVEVKWSTASAVSNTSSFHIKRNDELISIAAPSVSIYNDFSAVPDQAYDYCVYVVTATATETLVGCDSGGRVIARPTGFTASDGLYEEFVLLDWSDQSEIEGGFNIYRDAGNALQLDGINDYVEIATEASVTGSFTFEFWVRRASTNTKDFVLNIESIPNGDPVNVDLEVGFNETGQFQFTFGTSTLATASYLDTDWHHWAIAFDEPNLRRFIYRDGVRVATDVLPAPYRPSGVLEFGRVEKQGSSAARGHFHGEIDEVKFWDIALTESEVASRRFSLVSGSETGLAGYWPMDVVNSLQVPDVIGDRSGTLVNSVPTSWVGTGVPDLHTEVGTDITTYADRVAVVGFQAYTYRIAAYQDINADGSYTPATDFESQQRIDDGWRAFVTPPGNVAATDGQYNDRVVVTWVDLSTAESGYRIYRDAVLLGTVAADEQQFSDLAPTTTHEYCVVAVAGGVESVQGCDEGRAGGLAPPTDVAATDDVYDDRVAVTWTDPGDTEDGFEVYRNGALLATVDADVEEYGDFSAAQGVLYDYCVRAFSLADPLDPAYSAQTCAPTQGRRAIVLDPTDMAATYNDFENRVEMSWDNPSTTVMLFMVYRDDVLIDVIDFNRTVARDFEIPSDQDIEYCVSAATVVATNGKTLQGQISQVLSTIQMEDEVRKSTGEETSTLEDRMTAVSAVLFADATMQVSEAMADLVESGRSCATGSRSILPATELTATDNEFEDHVQLDWTDNSAVEAGYYVYREPIEPSGPRVSLDTLSANRTTYGDYTGVPGQRYIYTIEAFDDYGWSQLATDPGQRTLEPPSAFTASDGISEKVVELDWKDNSAAELGYRIYRRLGSADFALVDSTGKNEPAYTDSVDQAFLGQDLEYEVRAFDAYGESLGARNVGYTMLEAPRNVNASDVYDGKIVVVWVDQSEVETGYIVTRRRVGTVTPEPPVALPAGSTIYEEAIPPGDAGRQFEYCVQATLGAAAPSDPVCDTGKSLGQGPGGPVAGTPPFQIKTPAPGSAADEAARFGSSVVLEGSRAVFGAPGQDGGSPTSAGAAYEYSFTAENEWTQEQAVFSPDQSAGGEFGLSLDISGDYLVVGNPYQDDDDRGRVDAFRFSDAAPLAPFVSGSATGSTLQNLGVSVAVFDTMVVVGNDQYDPAASLPEGHGGALVCNLLKAANCDPGTGLPQLEDVLSPSQQKQNAEFGAAVDIMADGDSLFAIVGAPGDDSAYIFGCDGQATACAATADWSLVTELETAYGGKKRFGAAVAINSRFAAVGAPGAEGVVLWERIDGVWERQAIESPADPSVGFGSALALNDSTLIVGAPGETIADFQNAGAAYVLQWDTILDDFLPAVRYDARSGGKVVANARFGAAVDLDENFYVIGAPGDDNRNGAVYSIPVGFEPPKTVIIPEGVNLAAPGSVEATDGSAPDRIQVRWEDTSEDEDGHVVYRSNTEGGFDRVGKTAENVEFFDDFDAAPGEAYTYCVAAFFGASETEQTCDIGWRPPNGTIAGRVAERLGAGTEGARVCLVPSPNKALLFDGEDGRVLVAAAAELDINQDFTLEAWVRPQASDGLRTVVAKDSSYALRINGTLLQLGLDESGSAVNAVSSTVQVGVWNHIAVSEDRDGGVKFYVNGVQEVVDGVQTLPQIAGDSLTLGVSRPALTGALPFEGEIDEVRVWSMVRTADQISALMSKPLRGNEENLVGYWPLDDGLRRIVPDVTEFASHGQLIDGVYLADNGADLDICGLTSDEGNYSIARIRYGESTEFSLIPTRPGREFSPAFKKITLAIESPVQNEVFFTDITSYGVTGVIEYVDVIGLDTLRCPVPEVELHVDKTPTVAADNLKDKSRADGSYAVGVEPSTDENDLWYFIPSFTDPQNREATHAFDPANVGFAVFEATTDVNFADLTRNRLTGHFTGGDPESCHQDIGVATIRIRTQDGCYDRLITVDSKVNSGQFPDDLNLPPLEYLVEVVEVTDAPPERADEIDAFFERLGAVEVDLTRGDVERNLIYRAPLTLRIVGLEEQPGACSANGSVITHVDEQGAPLRTLPPVQVIKENEFRALQVTLMEDYGDGTNPSLMCGVEAGTVSVFDAIADRASLDSTLTLVGGVANYTTFGASPNVFSGARIDGVDRSFQKPLTAVAKVEGRDALITTEWAIVEGYRERASTFVSATTEEFPLLILHDPPGSDSYAFIEEGNTICSRISNMKMVGGGAGLEADVILGFKAGTGFSFGAHLDTENGIGGFITTRTIAGRENTSLNGNNIEICYTTTKTIETSNSPTWVGEDLFAGVALNLIFALADVVGVDQCKLSVTETLATDLDQADPFKTDYLYGESHIGLTLIPQLENLIRLGGDATISGADGSVRLQEAVDNWKGHLKLNEDMIAQGIKESTENRSFSGGTSFTYVEKTDSTQVTSYEGTRIYVDSENAAGVSFAALGWESRIGVGFDIRSEWVSESEGTSASTKSIGYVLSDGDTGDYFTVDIGKDPRYGTPVFETKSGRSSNPWEANTQSRDRPELTINPPVQLDASPDGANFTLTLTNANDSRERREYTLAIVKQANPGSAFISITGDPIDGDIYLVEGGQSQEITLFVQPGPTRFVYEDLAMVVYPQLEYEIWQADPRQPFVLSDTVYFSIQFDSTGGQVMTSALVEGWNWVSTNRPGGIVDSVLSSAPITHGDRLRGQFAESQYDSTRGWVGGLREMMPGVGYRLRVQKPGYLRLKGEAVQTTEPLELEPGWNWIGYLPAKGTNLDEALASLDKKVMDGDAVVGQEGFAQYLRGTGWVGTLKDLVPGESYAVFMANGGQLAFPLEPVGEEPFSSKPRTVSTDGPEWDLVPWDYTTSMTAVASVRMGPSVLEQTNTKIAVFAGEEIRGTGEVIFLEETDQYLAFIQVYGEIEEEESMVVHVYDGEADILYEDVATINFSSQQILGQPSRPVVLDLAKAGSAPLLQDLPEEFALYPNYPNPFNPSTIIRYDLPEARNVRLTVYDVIGREVVRLVDGEQAAGRHRAVFDARAYASGLYLYRIEAGDFKHVGKMMLVK